MVNKFENGNANNNFFQKIAFILILVLQYKKESFVSK